ncbi:TIGR04086 family membrane protein [Pumilibacter intestinalis]|jgi:putative membrane protein (TIGR04086 family)|uniref:TIGR04086 family membrane protein n=1 Tax=Pumilibacter intestinalis TaxID=2941511 RepID=UPI00203BE388|nr:TIGR04086 family membrane protein [Pumilibacter intestinalis]MCI8487716.1 TIGR04086 family membrane protein [Clostridia bacterium]
MENEVKKGTAIFETVKALIIAVILSLVSVLLAALVIKLFNLGNGAIPIINQVIKGVSILLGCLIAIKSKHNSWLKGIVIGILYIALSFVIFSLLDGEFSFGLGILNDVALGSITGMVSGILAGLKKQR